MPIYIYTSTHMYICTYIQMHICTYTCTQLHIYTYAHTHAHIHIYTCSFIRRCTCTFFVYICMYGMRLWSYVRVCAHDGVHSLQPCYIAIPPLMSGSLVASSFISDAHLLVGFLAAGCSVPPYVCFTRVLVRSGELCKARGG